MIIDHRYASVEVLKDIPSEWIDSAKQNLHVRYEHTSHGSQITEGMRDLDAFMGGNDVYLFSNNGGSGILHLHDFWRSDLSAGQETWQDVTRDYLNDAANQECNVVMWSWCQILAHDGDLDPGYCSKMEELISEYGKGGTKILDGSRTVPVQFVFMTGHVNGEGEEGETNRINNYIRSHCRSNNRILYDFADIESYDPDGKYFLYKYCKDDCSYNDQGTTDGNWALEWVEGKVKMTSMSDAVHNEPNGGNWYHCRADHTHPLNGNMKAYTAWYMFARMVGWQASESVLLDSLQISASGGSGTIDQDEGSLQLSCQTFPADAVDPGYAWSVVAGSGLASINKNGLVTAIENGTVHAVAFAQDGSDVSDTLEVTITHQITEVESLTLITPGDQTSILSGDSIQIIAEIVPVDADSQRVDLVIEPVTGTAAMNENGYLIGGDLGQVRIIGTAIDGFGASDTLHLDIISQPVNVNIISTGQLTLYPNPAKDVIKLKGELHYPLSVLVYGSQGDLYIHREIYNIDQVIDISQLLPGLYIVKLFSNHIESQGRLIKR